jgi:hypothetical protein
MQDGNATITEAFRPGTENAATPPGEHPAESASGLDRKLGACPRNRILG